MVKALVSTKIIDISLANNNNGIFYTLLENLKMFNMDMEGRINLFKMTGFAASYLPYENKLITITCPQSTREFINTRKGLNTLFEMVSRAINFNYQDLSEEQQLLAFSVFAFLHEIGHIQWCKRLYKRYMRINNLTVIKCGKQMDRFCKHEKNCKKFKIYHRDKFEERFCDKFATNMLEELIARGVVKIF